MAFKDVRWPCGRCGKEKLAKDYAPPKADLKKYTLDHILVAGAWRSCRGCEAKARPAPADTRWCKECEEYLPTECFSGKTATDVCVKHLKTFQQEEQKPVRCSRCGEERDTTEYLTATLKRLREADGLHEAVCLHCDPVHLPRDWEKNGERAVSAWKSSGFRTSVWCGRRKWI